MADTAKENLGVDSTNEEVVTPDKLPTDVEFGGDRDTYLAILKQIADGCYKKISGKDNYQNKATTIVGALCEIAEGIRGVEVDRTDETIIKKLPKTYDQYLLSIANALHDVEDDFEEENYPVKKDDKPVVIDVLKTITDVEDETECYGKKASELADIYIHSDGNVVGTIKYATEYTGFSSLEEEQEGFFFPFTFTADDTVKSITMMVSGSTSKTPVVKCDEGINVIRLGNDIVKSMNRKVVITAYDDNDKKLREAIIKFKNTKFSM